VNRIGASVVLHGRILVATGSDVGDLRDVGGEQVEVVQCDANLCAGLLAAGLHGGTAGNDDHELGSEVGEDVGNGVAETIAVGKEHDHRGDAPGHAQHGERGAPPIVAHGVVGLLEQVAHHKICNL